MKYIPDYSTPTRNVTLLIRQDQLDWLDEMQRNSYDETVPSRSAVVRDLLDMVRTQLTEDLAALMADTNDTSS